MTNDPSYLSLKLKHRKEFVARYPDLSEWFAEPLTHRVGRLLDEDPRCGPLTDPISYNARHYLTFLGVAGRVRFDWDWLLAVPALNVWVHAEALNLPLVQARDELSELGSRVGFRTKTASRAAQWALSRMLLHSGVPALDAFTVADFQDLLHAIDDFGRRPDRRHFHGDDSQWASKRRNWGSQVFLLQLLLYHAGHIPEVPKEPLPKRVVWPPMPQVMTVTIERYLDARSQLDRPSTVQNISAGLRRFTTWLMANRAPVASFAEVSRADALEFCVWLTTLTHHRTGAPLAPATRRQDIHAVLGFFRDGYAWQWPHMPGRPLLMNGDLPKITRAVPRFIPDNELTVLMDAVRALECPFQRAALLIARWSGARRSEIRMLDLDCLDAYPDGTPRLRLPASKNYSERTVPINEEAADAIRTLHGLRREQIDRPLPGNHKERPARRLFVRQGRVLSNAYLFDDALTRACQAAGLVNPQGKPTITAHRFRHTVGTQLAERGARLQTIMSVLGHKSVQMALVYAHVSDPAVLDDYSSVLGADATIAGPSASAVRNRELTPETVDWIKGNFFRTELELGHCLRLPAEGPCECDLYLTCAKFITTPKYAPRLRDRYSTELVLSDHARSQGWTREVERHEVVARRICQLLDDLGEPLTVNDPPTCTGDHEENVPSIQG
ncbi:tyrosine-type recombinase/integrase [Nocardioides sp. S5]|uniref:tyrosine-type recombinase/integrase n=1 Tax=Nocardioides sp. S5 TaxID=2017486 RepID=UPI001A8C9A05|nr:tyrosine-type recombinase/integrase [Nocardioides sp. S5]